MTGYPENEFPVPMRCHVGAMGIWECMSGWLANGELWQLLCKSFVCVGLVAVLLSP